MVALIAGIPSLALSRAGSNGRRQHRPLSPRWRTPVRSLVRKPWAARLAPVLYLQLFVEASAPDVKEALVIVIAASVSPIACGGMPLKLVLHSLAVADNRLAAVQTNITTHNMFAADSYQSLCRERQRRSAAVANDRGTHVRSQRLY